LYHVNSAHCLEHVWQKWLFNSPHFNLANIWLQNSFNRDEIFKEQVGTPFLTTKEIKKLWESCK